MIKIEIKILIMILIYDRKLTEMEKAFGHIEEIWPNKQNGCFMPAVNFEDTP